MLRPNYAESESGDFYTPYDDYLEGDPDEYSEETHEEVICSACNGSGEGRYDGSRCDTCGGKGVVWEALPQPEDEDDES